MLPKRANRPGKFVRITELEERVAGVGGKTAKYVRPQHRGDHRPVTTAGLAHDAAMPGFGHRAVMPVDPGHDLVAQVTVIAPGCGRVQILTHADRRPAVDIYKDAGRRAAGRELRVRELREVAAKCGTVSPHVDLAGQPLDDVDARIASSRLGVVPRR